MGTADVKPANRKNEQTGSGIQIVKDHRIDLGLRFPKPDSSITRINEKPKMTERNDI